MKSILNNSDMQIYSVASFCKAHGICRGHFYNLLSEGLAPKIIKLGRRTLISCEAAAEWRKQMEQRSEQSIKGTQK
ncbi:MAG TPA: hypothetical protein EYQ42_02635 [Thiotrichaceae bacterium]|nr:hypothetical protein [Thiotrichaceae bacterium]